MNIWTISLFDPTPYDKVGDYRFIQIARMALRKAHRVTHFTSTFRHTSKKQRFSESTTLQEGPGYTVEYIRSKGYRKNISLERAAAHTDFAERLIESFEGRQKPDVIFVSMPPLSSAERVVMWGQANDVPVITDIIDPWPDSFIKDVPSFLKPAVRLVIRPFYSKLRIILENSTAVTAISNGYLEWAQRNCKAIQRTACFYPALDFESIQESIQKYRREEQRNNELLRVIYVGSLGSSYDLPAIVEAADIMQQKHPGRTEFVVAGSGPQKEMVEEYADKLENLSYLGWISDEELMRQYALSDVGLIQHKNNLTQTVTYKLFSYLSAGLPILNSLQSEMADIIREHEVGFNNSNGDVAGLVQNIERFMEDRGLLTRYKENALALTREKGDSAAIYGEMLELFADVAGPKSFQAKP
ncbi:MAG: glycosyltransferase family 4 protein [Gammaproteobacteria bacterium]|nr:glycosyltransferase family 4 protein [Gammaproteobacteria bacterium]